MQFLLLLAVGYALMCWWNGKSLHPAAVGKRLGRRLRSVRRPGASTADMGEAEARRLLGLGPGAEAPEIRDAHRRLMARVHPDLGGSAELALRVNAARDRLLRR
jgi:hypothetical protein